MVKISLVVTSINRSKELSRLFDSLVEQTFQNFEVIFIAQNDESFFAALLDKFNLKLPIKAQYIQSVGLSQARNMGIKIASGEIIGFPDDDCWYPPDLLNNVFIYFREHQNISGLTGRVLDSQGKNAIAASPKASTRITRRNFLKATIEPGMFFRSTLVEKVGTFDTAFGVGSSTAWQAHEGDDFVYRAILESAVLQFETKMIVFHPQRESLEDQSRMLRERSYAPALGALFRKHRLTGLWMYYCFRALGGALFYLLTLDIKTRNLYFIRLLGRINGWFSYGKATSKHFETDFL